MANVTRLSETYYYKYTNLYGTLKIMANNSHDCARCLQHTLITKRSAGLSHFRLKRTLWSQGLMFIT